MKPGRNTRLFFMGNKTKYQAFTDMGKVINKHQELNQVVQQGFETGFNLMQLIKDSSLNRILFQQAVSEYINKQLKERK